MINDGQIHNIPLKFYKQNNWEQHERIGMKIVSAVSIFRRLQQMMICHVHVVDILFKILHSNTLITKSTLNSSE